MLLKPLRNREKTSVIKIKKSFFISSKKLNLLLFKFINN